MAPRFLLDTNTFIYVRRRRPPLVRSRSDKLEIGEVALSVVTYGELIFGAEKARDRATRMAELESLTALIPILPLPLDAGRVYGVIRAALQARGETIGPNDYWIAAHAVALGLTLVTNNEREFRRVSGLKIENGVAAGTQSTD
jgi:tRNA(fMet)-specific endonuclease VapC